MISLYDLAKDLEPKLHDFEFAERTSKTVSLLVALQVLPIKRQAQHAKLHTTFAALFVAAYDQGSEFCLEFSSSAYNRAFNIPSSSFHYIKLMEANGLIDPIGPKQWKITSKLEQAVAPLRYVEPQASQLRDFSLSI